MLIFPVDIVCIYVCMYVGGKGNTGNVVAVEGWKNLTAVSCKLSVSNCRRDVIILCQLMQRSVAKVRWNSNGTVNVYRVGHRAKVGFQTYAIGT